MHPDRHFLIVTREPLGNRAFEGVADLTGHALRREPQRPPPWGQFQDQFLLAEWQVILDIRQTIEALQFEFQFLGSDLQFGDVVAAKPDVEFPAWRATGPFLQRDPPHAGDARNLLAPDLDELVGADVPIVGSHQFHLNAAQMIAENTFEGPPLALPEALEAHDDDIAGLRRHPLLGPDQRPLQLQQRALQFRARSAGRHFDVRINRVGFGIGEEDETDPATRQNADADDQSRQNCADSDIAIVECRDHSSPEPAVAEPVETPIEPLAETGVATAAFARAFARAFGHGTAQMSGQHEEAFDQTCHQHRHDNQRNGPDDLSDHVTYREQGHEGRNGGQRRRRHRCEHAQGPGLRGVHGAHPLLAQVGRMLPHHDGVIDNDAQCHDQGEQADHVDALTGPEHDRPGGEDRHGDAHRDPEGDPAGQKDEQDDQHQNEAAETVAQQQVDAVGNQRCLNVVLPDLDVRWQRSLQFVKEGVDDVCGLQRVRCQ